MIYYKENSKPIEFTSKAEPVAQGEQGKIYKIDINKCIKVYTEGMPTITPEVFKIYKDLSLEGYSKLHEIWYRDEKLKAVGAYISDWYVKTRDNILFMPSEYTIHNLSVLYNSIEVLSKNQILVRDLIPQNVILGNDNMTVIDFDSCRLSTKPKEELERLNTCALLKLFRDIYKDSLRSLAVNVDKNKTLSNYIDNMFKNTGNCAKKLERKMPKGRPIDYIYEKC